MDMKIEVKLSPLKSTLAILHIGELTRQKKKQPWCVHQSLALASWGGCSWGRCQGIKKVRQK